jgi:hypothetical protein
MLERKGAGNARRSEHDAMNAVEIVVIDGTLGFRPTPGRTLATCPRQDSCVDRDKPAGGVRVRNAPNQVHRDVAAHFAFQSGHFGEGNIVGQEEKDPALLHPVRPRVAIKVYYLVDRLFVT